MQADENGYVEVRGVILRDKAGIVRGRFGLDENDAPELVLTQKDGTPRVSIGMVGDGEKGVGIMLHDRNNMDVLDIVADHNGRGVIAFKDAGGAICMLIGLDAMGKPMIQTEDAKPPHM